jgi:hypothetical protein
MSIFTTLKTGFNLAKNLLKSGLFWQSAFWSGVFIGGADVAMSYFNIGEAAMFGAPPIQATLWHAVKLGLGAGLLIYSGAQGLKRIDNFFNAPAEPAQNPANPLQAARGNDDAPAPYRGYFPPLERGSNAPVHFHYHAGRDDDDAEETAAPVTPRGRAAASKSPARSRSKSRTRATGGSRKK